MQKVKATRKKKARSPTETDKVKINYTGALLYPFKTERKKTNSFIFNRAGTLPNLSHIDSGSRTFSVANVIKGWSIVLQMMVEGDVWKLHIPYHLSVRDGQVPTMTAKISLTGELIYPYLPVIYEIELIEVISATGGKSKAKARALLDAALYKPPSDSTNADSANKQEL